MTKRKDKRGRATGSRNKGFFFRTGRYWCAKQGETYYRTHD